MDDLKSVLNWFDDAIIVYDDHFKAMLFNPVAERLFKIKADAVIGHAFVPQDMERAGWQTLIQVIFSSLAPRVIVRSKEGEFPEIVDLSFADPIFEFRVTTVPVVEENGKTLVFMKIIRDHIVELLYIWPHGRFGQQDAIWTMRALAALAPGLLFFSLQKALTPAFYALKDTSTPLRVALWGVGMNFVMNVAFVLTWPDGWKHVGLMLSTVLVSIINTVALTQELHKRIGAPRTPVLAPTAAGVAVATAGMGLAAWEAHLWLNMVLRPLIHHVKLLQLATLGGAVLVAILVYLLLANLLCRPALREVVADFRHRKKADGQKTVIRQQ